MKIRKATPRDLLACARLSHTPELSSLYKVTDKEAVRYLKPYITKGIMLVAEENKEIIGFIIVEYMLSDYVWIDSIVVRQDKRGQGIGKSFIQQVELMLKKKKIKNIFLIAPVFNKKTIRFYESIGMKRELEAIAFSKKIR